MPTIGDRTQGFLSQYAEVLKQQQEASNKYAGRFDASKSGFSELYPFLKDAVAESTQRNLQAPSSRAEMYQKYMNDQANSEFERARATPKSEPTFYAPQPSRFIDEYPYLSGAQAEERQRDVQKPQYPGTVIPTSGPAQYNMMPGYFSAQ